jgi:hypothetical protein
MQRKTKRKTARADWRTVLVRGFKSHKKATARDCELVAQWRALRNIGAYTTRTPPRLRDLTPARARTIRRTFKDVQNFRTYESGEVFSPFQKVTVETTRKTKRGAILSIKKSTRKKYNFDSLHFSKIKKAHVKGMPGLKTNKFFIVSKESYQRVTKTKRGNVVVSDSNFQFTREPISGAKEFLDFIDALEKWKVKLKPNENIRIYKNGIKSFYNTDDPNEILEKLLRYRDDPDFDFDDFANRSEIVLIRRKAKRT